MKIGILPLGRPTFDVPFAEVKLAEMLQALDATKHEITGPRELLFDAEATADALADMETANIDQLLLLQVTFTDASMTIEAAKRFPVPLSIWATSEPRDGGRLRLNAFCGLNLASHALGLNHREFSWAYGDPGPNAAEMLDELFSGKRKAGTLCAKPSAGHASPAGSVIAAKIKGQRIARLGEHPVGFDTCAYDKNELAELAGVTVDEFELDTLFSKAAKVESSQVDETRALAETHVGGLEDVNADELDKSLRLKNALDAIRSSGDYNAFAIRCWPETFTEYGGAVCGPVSMLGEAQVPCACEADVYGALTQMILQEAAQEPVFLADLVDMDLEDNSGVVWHCGQAPISMCEPDVHAGATIHTNRKMPLLYEFPLKEGRVTLMRISQSHSEPKMILSSGIMLKRPMAFTGTSGVVRFDRQADAVLRDVMASGLEHHMALAYGDHRDTLRSTAAAMGLPLLEI